MSFCWLIWVFVQIGHETTYASGGSGKTENQELAGNLRIIGKLFFTDTKSLI